jgi:5-dehydro-2-deoxygluconokinase
VVLGLEAPEPELIHAFAIAAGAETVRGFAVGRTIFSATARQWLAGRIGDDAAVQEMSARFERLVSAWRAAHPGPTERRREAG